MSIILLLAAAAAAGEPATCVFDVAAPEPCTVTFDVRGDVTELRAQASNSAHKAVFVGKRQSGWWAGTLDGEAAMGYELNRANVTFSTRALGRTFQYYTAQGEHGNY